MLESVVWILLMGFVSGQLVHRFGAPPLIGMILAGIFLGPQVSNVIDASILNVADELRAIAQEIVRGDFVDRVHIGLDFFDATINRIAAWTIGTGATIRALLEAHLEPIALLRQHEQNGNLTARLATLEEAKNLPAGAVWDYYCWQQDVSVGTAWLNDVKQHEVGVLSKRGAV